MTLKHKDFEPDTESKKNILGRQDVYYQGMDTALARMNLWLEENPVDVVSVESVALPNIHNQTEDGTTDTELPATNYTNWYQFIRLWYRV